MAEQLRWEEWDRGTQREWGSLQMLPWNALICSNRDWAQLYMNHLPHVSGANRPGGFGFKVLHQNPCPAGTKLALWLQHCSALNTATWEQGGSILKLNATLVPSIINWKKRPQNLTVLWLNKIFLNIVSNICRNKDPLPNTAKFTIYCNGLKAPYVNNQENGRN